MLRRTLLALTLAAASTGAIAQQTQTPPGAAKECPPGTSADAPGLNNGSKSDLSDQLASSKGVICPPSVDHQMQHKPPEGGAIKVVPPPGSAGGDQQVQPK